MNKNLRIVLASAAVVVLAGAMSFAQSSGEATYKAKCASCHGAAGTPNPAMAKAMGIKPASDPAVKAKTEAQMIDTTQKGEGKMPAYAAKLSDAEIKGAVDYFRTFAK
jgi:mono/diheme cytochrome c family protein